jgi:hypothetical protein
MALKLVTVGSIAGAAAAVVILGVAFSQHFLERIVWRLHH